MPGRARRSPLAPVRPAPGRRAPAPMGLQAQPQPVVAALEAVIGHQLLVKVLGREVPVAGVEQLQARHHLIHRRTARRGPAQTPVVETVGSLRLVAVAPAPEGALRDTQNLRRLRLAQATPMGAPVNLPRTSSISVPVPAPFDASPPSMAWKRSKTGQIIWYINRTYRVLPARRRKNVLRARWQLVPVVHGRDPCAGRRALGAAGGGPRVGEWNGRLPPLVPAVGRVEVDPPGATASKCQGGRFGVFPGKPEGPR